MARSLASIARRLASDRTGIAALEFALIAPLLLVMYFLTMEVAQGIETNKKIDRAGSMVADLVTQQTTVNTAALDAMMAIGEATLQPYNRSQPTITITAIELSTDATPTAKVVWSRKLADGAFTAGPAKGDTATVPDSLKIKGSFLVRVESALAYAPVITWAAEDKPVLGLAAAFDGIAMKETYYLRPRMSTSVPCSDC